MKYRRSGDGEFGIIAWYKLDETSGTAHDFQFSLDEVNLLSMPAANRLNATVNVNQWRLATITSDGNTNTVYVNGGQAA